MTITTWEYFERLQHYSQLYGNLFVKIWSGSANGPTKREKSEIAESVIIPLLRSCNYAYLYGNYDDNKVFESTATRYPRKRSKLELTGSENSSVVNLLCRSGSFPERGTLLVEMPLKKEALCPVFKNCIDPTVMAGVGSLCTKSALTYAKKRLSDTKVHILISQANSGLEWMFLLTARESMPTLTRMVADHAKPSEGYRNLYGPGTKFSLISNKKTYGTGFHE